MKGWNALPVETQERIVGRRKLSDVELSDAQKPPFAHNALTSIVENGKGLKILRDNMPLVIPGTESLELASSATVDFRGSRSKCCRTCSSEIRRQL